MNRHLTIIVLVLVGAVAFGLIFLTPQEAQIERTALSITPKENREKLIQSALTSGDRPTQAAFRY